MSYLAVLTLTIVFSRLAQYLAPYAPTFRGQPLSVWVAVAGGGVATLIVVRSLLQREPRNKFPIFSVAILWSLLAAWTGTLVMTIRYDELFSLSTFLLPTSVFLLLLRPPSSSDINRALNVFALGVLAAILVSFIAHGLGAKPFREDFQNRLPIEFLNIDYRWESFFGDANQAGTALVGLVLIGIYRKGKIGMAIASISFVLLLLTQSRTALVAIGLGLAMLYAFGPANSAARRMRGWIVLTATVVVSALLVLIVDPSMNGRLPIWRDSFSLWQNSPFLGIGTTAIEREVPSITGLAQDAHNVVLDPLVRYGIAAFIPGVIFLVLCVWLTFRRPFMAKGFPVALLVASLTCFMTYTTFGWNHMTLFLWPLLLAMLLTSKLQHEVQRAIHSPNGTLPSNTQICPQDLDTRTQFEF